LMSPFISSTRNSLKENSELRRNSLSIEIRKAAQISMKEKDHEFS
jgi:hypothetical protein